MVSFVHCKTYDDQKLKDAILRSFHLLGGVEKYVRPGTKVLLKTNLLMRKVPDAAATTHPAFVQALATVLVEAGAEVTIGDSPGGPYTLGLLNGLYRTCGMEQAAQNSGARLNRDVSFQTVSYPQGHLVKSFPVIRPVLDADIVISVAKLKTHQFATYTGAVKNLFGVIPGTYKAEYHLRMPSAEQFCEMLVDLCQYVHPALSFIDGVIGMEGAGPSAGKPRAIGAILASENPHDADVVAAKMIGLTPEQVPTLAAAKRRGLIDDPTTVGDPFFDVPNYQLPQTHTPKGIFKLLPFAAKLSAKPVCTESGCIGCGDCAKNCPAKAIVMTQGKPVFDYKVCFRCYCCQELCPKGTIVVKRAKWWLF